MKKLFLLWMVMLCLMVSAFAMAEESPVTEDDATPAETAAAQDFLLAPIGQSISIPDGITVLSGEDLDTVDIESGYSVVLRDAAGNRLNLSFLDDPSLLAMDLTALTASERVMVADLLLYGGTASRPEGMGQPVAAPFRLGQIVYLSITEQNAAGTPTGLYAFCANFAQATLCCTFTRDDGEPMDDEAMQTLMLTLLPLTADAGETGAPEEPEIQEDAVPSTEEEPAEEEPAEEEPVA